MRSSYFIRFYDFFAARLYTYSNKPERTCETRYLQLQQRKASSAIVNDTLTPRQIVDIVEIVPLLIIAAVIFLTFNTNKDLFSIALRDYASPFVKTPIFQDTILFGC